jgi:LuxR family maltose regulon positive regulatory protein
LSILEFGDVDGTLVAGAPRLPRLLVDRPRLTSRLAAETPLVVVHGMGGAGKTVLLADWARRGGGPSTGAGPGARPPGQWVPLRRSHLSRSSFWTEVVNALIDSRTISPESSVAGLASAVAVADDPRGVLVRAFVALPDGLHLVIDNYERVGDPEVHLDLIEVLVHCERVRVTIATRALRPLEKALAGLRIDTEIVGPEALRFRDDEVAELLRLSGHAPEPKLIEAVQRAADGLALPVRAAVEAITAEGSVAPAAAVRVPSAVVGYVAANVTHLGDGEGFRRFLRQVAVPEAVSAELAEALTGDPAAREWLDLAESRGLGLWSRERDQLVFRYSTVVRTALRDELATEAPDELTRLRLQYASWAEANGQPLAALGAAVDGGDLASAARIAQHDWAVLLENTPGEVVAVLSALPLNRIRHQPVLAMMLGLGYNSLGENSLRAIELFTLAIAASRVRGARTGAVERFVLLVGESSAYRLTGRYDQAGRSAEQALQLYDDLAQTDRVELSPNAHGHLAQLGLSLLYAGSTVLALGAFRSAYSASAHLADQRARLHPLSLIAGTLAVMGELNEAAAVLARLDEKQWPDGWRDGYAGSFYHLATGFVAFEAFDFAAAQAHVAAVLDGMPQTEHRAAFLTLQALIDLGTRRHRAGGVELELALQAARTPGFPRAYTEALTGLLALEFVGSDRSAKAEATLESTPPQSPFASLVRSLIALLGDDPNEALRQLNGARHRSRGSGHVAAALGWARSAVLLRLGNSELAVDIVIETLALVKRSGISASVLFIPDTDRSALAALAAERGLADVAAFFASVSPWPSFLPASLARIRLTEREATVLGHLVETGSAAEIAAALFVSVNTVKTQLRSLYRKLGVASRDEALVSAAELGLLAG